MNLNKELGVNMINGDLLELEMYLHGILINGGVTGIGARLHSMVYREL